MTKLVFLILQRDAVYDRGIMRGVLTAARRRPNWNIRVVDFKQNELSDLAAFRPSGIIGRFTNKEQQAEILALGIPAISTTNVTAANVFPRAGLDETAIGQMAAAYLIGRGFRHFAYAAPSHQHFSLQRGEAFAAAVANSGFECSHITDADNLFVAGLGQSAAPLEWLRQAPKPLAILASTDTVGQVVLTCCQISQIAVPEEVAVLSVDNDELLCEMAPWPMSSISIPSRKIGELAVEMLDEHFHTGTTQPPTTRLLPPTGVVTRQSTDVIAVPLPEVAKAMRFIRDNRHLPIQVADILRAVRVSRRKLEQGFANHLGCTMLNQIHREHIALAKELLVNSSLSLDQIAEACGLKTREQLSRIFRKVTAQTPAAFRNRHRE